MSSAVSQFTGIQQLLIRGVLDEWETEPRTADSKAQLIAQALSKLNGQRWSIVVFNTLMEYAATTAWFHYKQRWWVSGVLAQDDYCDEQAIRQCLEETIGWARIIDIKGAQAAIQRRINETVAGEWHVSVFKFQPRTDVSAVIKGMIWMQDGYNIYVTKKVNRLPNILARQGRPRGFLALT
jgi:hypothetical protein